jgi:hypothetical protein
VPKDDDVEGTRHERHWAAAKAPDQRRIVEIKGKPVPECGGARKLTIWNTARE